MHDDEPNSKQLHINAQIPAYGVGDAYSFYGHWDSFNKHEAPPLDPEVVKQNQNAQYGFPDRIYHHQLVLMQRRDPIARALVDRLVDTTWKTDPKIVNKDDTDSEVLEEEIAKIFRKRNLWRSIRMVDKYSQIGGWAAVIMRLADDSTFDMPVGESLARYGGIDAVEEFIPCFPSYDIRPVVRDGKVDYYEYTEDYFNDERHVKVHPDRVIVMSEDGQPRGTSVLENAFNDILNSMKLRYAAGEAFKVNSDFKVLVEIDKDASEQQIRSALGEVKDDKGGVASAMQRNFKKWRSGPDQAMVLQSAKMNIAQANIPDLEKFYDSAISSVGAAGNVPRKIMLGNEEGSLSSTEDRKIYLDHIEARRSNWVNACFMNELINRFETFGVLPEGDWQSEWKPLNEVTNAEKADVFDKLVKGNIMAVQSGVDPILSWDRIAEAAGFEPLTEQEKEDASFELPELPTENDAPPSRGGAGGNAD